MQSYAMQKSVIFDIRSNGEMRVNLVSLLQTVQR